MGHAFYFSLLKKYADIWARHNCKVILSGEEQINPARPRIYIVSHPTTWDLPMLVHISKKNFYIVVADDPFAHPVVSWLFTNSGFFHLTKETSDKVIEDTSKCVKDGKPIIYSLYGAGVDLGESVPPRTGGIRAAHLAGADICPIHLMLEEGKSVFKYYNKSKTESYPYTVFNNALYFASFLPTIRYTDYAKNNMSYEDYKEIAFSIEKSFNTSQKNIEDINKTIPEYYRNLRRKGGLKKSVLL